MAIEFVWVGILDSLIEGAVLTSHSAVDKLIAKEEAGQTSFTLSTLRFIGRLICLAIVLAVMTGIGAGLFALSSWIAQQGIDHGSGLLAIIGSVFLVATGCYFVFIQVIAVAIPLNIILPKNESPFVNFLRFIANLILLQVFLFIAMYIIHSFFLDPTRGMALDMSTVGAIEVTNVRHDWKNTLVSISSGMPFLLSVLQYLVWTLVLAAVAFRRTQIWLINKGKILKYLVIGVGLCAILPETVLLYKFNSYAGKRDIEYINNPHNGLTRFLNQADNYFGQGASNNLWVVGDSNPYIGSDKTIVNKKHLQYFITIVHKHGTDYADIYTSHLDPNRYKDEAQQLVAEAITVATKDGYRARVNYYDISLYNLKVIRGLNGKGTAITQETAQEMESHGIHPVELSTADKSGNIIPDETPEITKFYKVKLLAKAGYDISVNGRRIHPNGPRVNLSNMQLAETIKLLRHLGTDVSVDGQRIVCHDSGLDMGKG